MKAALRSIASGSRPDRLPHHLLLAVLLFVLNFGAYAVGAFAVSGGVVFVAGQAALVAVIGAGVVRYTGGGFPVAWVAAYAPFFGFHAEWAFLSLPGRALAGKIAFFLNPEGLVVMGLQALVFGGIGYLVAVALRYGTQTIGGSASSSPEK